LWGALAGIIRATGMSLLKRHKGDSPDIATKRTRAGEVYVAAVNDHFSLDSKVEADSPRVLMKQAAASSSSASPPMKKGRTSEPAPAEASAPPQGRGNRTVEQTYQKKTQLEHILLRPDSYVGSVERQSQDHWVFDEVAGKMVLQKLDYVPALYKIFDEILVNAADNLVRSANQDTIRIEIDAKNGWVSVWNNGAGLPVQVHKEHGCYVPELVFGHLLTSDNYDDDERKVTGGRNGYGAKLTNIFSKKFILETVDSDTGKHYKQVWESNMGKRHDPQISEKSSECFTCVTFYPDFAKFGMTSFEKDIVALMSRRAYDVAASTHGKCKVILNGKELSVKSFEDFVALHLEQDAFRACQVINDRWEVAVALVPDGSGFQQVSFVNSISTCRGGTHVNVVADQLINPVMDKMGKVKGGLAVKPQHVRGYLMVFVNCLIENPAFDSQTKETLTSKKERFGSTCPLPESLINTLLESGILQALQEWSKALGQSELAQYLNRSDMGLQKRLFGIPKLEDANKAGTKEGGACTLILTEGDSAKALAVAGLGVIGRDLYGVFPLRGKLRNVRELTVKQMLENKEIDQLMRIIALDASKSYDGVKGLRYGSIMIMTDQDHDGSHIKGLIINFLHYWFPSLLRIPGFLKEFVTPIVKVTKGEESQAFFTLPEYENWKKENDDGRGWKCKYYKGLGTSTSTEAREYFAALEDHEVIFTHEGAEDDDLIDMSFNHGRADDRKTWISRCQPDTYVDHTQATISYNEFVNKELVLFAKYDVERMIPSVVDGFKPGQRKVLFGCFKKRVTSDIKVAQLTGYVAEKSSYHHGETSLQGTIIGMAQTFPGANNINLLVPSGQFGTRLSGGKDHAAARYIFTRLSKATRCLFPEEDDAVMEYLQDEGVQIEPKYYAPIIPLVLANGCDGIAVGWSSTVPNYNPRDLIASIRSIIRNEPVQKISPWYRGFKGTITEVEGTGKYECCGTAIKRGRTRLEITELPVRRWTQDYKEWLLEQLPKGGDERRAQITDVREYHTENSVHFVVGMTPDKLAEADRRGLQKVFHLKSSIPTTNMWLFDPNGKIKKYETAEDIIKEFAKVRLEVYGKRKAYMLEKMKRQLDFIGNKLRFVQLVVSETLEVDGQKSQKLCIEMRKHGLKYKRDIDGAADSPEQLSLQEEMGPLGYKYLLSMKLWTLTEDRLQELKKQHQDKAFEIDKLEGISLEELWETDLVKLENALDQIDRDDAKEAEAALKLAKKNMGGDMDDLVNRQCVLVLTQDFKAKRIKTSEWKAKKERPSTQ
jgi:DNA topoisomerase-2